MVRIAIVEDEQQFIDQLLVYLAQYKKEYAQEMKITVFRDGEHILNNYRAEYDIILMDIQMRLMDGMTAARRIRDVDEEVIIVFLTNMAQYAIRGYEVDAMDFITKPIQYFSFSQRLNRVISRLKRRTSQFLMISHRGGMQKLEPKHIYYVESQGHNLIYHTAQGVFISTGTMKDAETKLAGFHFFRSNKGYLVALSHVECIRDGCAIVAGQELLISRTRKNAFLDALTAYIGEA